MPAENTPNWDAYPDPTAGVEITDDGFYACKDCEAVLEARGVIREQPEGRVSVWDCPECGTDYEI